MIQHTVHTPYMVGDAHFYSAEIDGELVLFDTGPATPQALAFLEEQVDLGRLKYLFITHCHVDHCGLAAYIAQHTKAEILIPRRDAVKLRHHEQRLTYIQKFLKEFGFDEAFAEELGKALDEKKVFPEIPPRSTVVEESDIPKKLGISWLSCPGHSQSDLVYLSRNDAISGDVLLRNIFQAPLLDVDLDTFAGRFRNYDAYCSSLLELGKLRGYRILPGHREYVMSLDDTIHFYVRKLLERAGQLKRFSGIESVKEVISRLFGGGLVDPFIIYLKVSEIVFMRDFLAEPDKLERSLEQIGLSDAVHQLYTAVTA
jgi:hydroxyacylglutathione hydrolase